METLEPAYNSDETSPVPDSFTGITFLNATGDKPTVTVIEKDSNKE